MDARTIVAAAVAAAMMAMTVSLFAAEQTSGSTAPKSEPIYGYRMMTGQDCPGPGAGKGPGPRP